MSSETRPDRRGVAQLPIGLAISGLALFLLIATVTRPAMPSSTEDHPYILRNAQGMEVHVLACGCAIQRLLIPDRSGALADVVLGFDNSSPYEDGTNPYFGVIVGRVANRIRGARFFLDGQDHRLATNDGANMLHGGPDGWSRRTWDVQGVTHAAGQAVRCSLTSLAGDQGFPGSVKAAVTYVLTGDGRLLIDMEATTDAATPVNMVQHSYFNLAGVERPGTIEDHVLQVDSAFYTPVDAGTLPTGEIASIIDTALDFRAPTRLGDALPRWPGGFDNNLVLFGRNGPAARDAATAPGGLLPGEPQVAATLWHPASGRALEIRTNAPGMQVYSGNFLDGSLAGKAGVRYPQRGGIALETQARSYQGFPDSVNVPAFPLPVVQPGAEYKQREEWRFFVKDS